MMLLAIDTSTRAMGVALYDGLQILSEMTWISNNHHTIALASSVEQTLGQVGVEVGDLQVVGVAIGPGSFTGLRIGLALAKGLALSNRIPIIGLQTLDILAAALPVYPDGKLAAVLEAGRNRLAVGWYESRNGEWQPEGDIQNIDIDEFVLSISKTNIVCGELNSEVRQRLSQTKCKIPSAVYCVRRPAVLAELAWIRSKKNEYNDPATLKPIYLHYGKPIPE
jgi:tRNA threonylcarbamoyladenosine biosynthesis protein TsaB